ncbi:hypothetical protein PNBC_12830 [Paenibacillus crassostreae]|uniref:Uncharacterized protein n=2 Tax=Paenibacillus crassostreae TaxID=1763538 RepID=A0A167DCH6_9BACL|nr:hypothetical protein LPB68_21455 [Paenibacillus crassostreae]OAB74206.1 hypothetical protein PNBC_12830 [Paenibacillus crassostreae]
MLPVEGLKVVKDVVTSEAGQKAVKQVGRAVTGAVIVVTGAVATRILKSKKVTLKAKFGKAKASAVFED